MPVYSLNYSFRQRLDAPAKRAYGWCTDFGPYDAKLFLTKWVRSVRRLSADALILTDKTFPAGRARTIHRLVRLNPAEMAWTNTHLDGPFRHSQYWYRIVPDGPRNCHLEFRGFRLVTTARSLSESEIARRATREKRSDSGLWRDRIAPSIKQDLAS